MQGLVPPGDSKSHYIQQCLSCPTMLLDSCISCFDKASTVNLISTCIGKLYVRLARLPPTATDLNQHPKPDISTVKTGEYALFWIGGGMAELECESNRNGMETTGMSVENEILFLPSS